MTQNAQNIANNCSTEKDQSEDIVRVAENYSDNLADFAKKLNNSQDYKVLSKYKKPSFYNEDDGSLKLIGVFLDIEATGLSYDQDK